MIYDVISTGSKGNAVVINNNILIDCGVSFKKLDVYYKSIQIVLLTHIHSDHFNRSAIKKLASQRPALRFGCGKYLVEALQSCKVSDKNIDVYEVDHVYSYGSFTVTPVNLIHNVDNYGYKIKINNENMLYATDTNELKHVYAPGFDYYFVEANYEEDEMKKRISKKEADGKYVYEYDVLKNHLSKEKCDKWLLINATDNSKIIYMHQHGG